MADEDTLEHEDEQHDDGPAALREALKRAEKRAADAEAHATEAEAARRENVMLRAGVDIDSKLGQMFARSYQGDLDIDAVKTEWAELAPSTPVVPEPSEQEQGRERSALAADAPAPTTLSDADPRAAGIEEFHKRRAQGFSREEAAVPYFDQVLTAATEGDKRVLWDAEAQSEHYSRIRRS